MSVIMFSIFMVPLAALMFISFYWLCGGKPPTLLEMCKTSSACQSIEKTREDRLFSMAHHIVSFNCGGRTQLLKKKQIAETIRHLVFRIKRGEVLGRQDYRLLGALTVNEALVSSLRGVKKKTHLTLVFDGKHAKPFEERDQIIDFIDFDFNYGNPLPEMAFYIYSPVVGQKDEIFVKVGEEIEKKIAKAIVPL